MIKMNIRILIVKCITLHLQQMNEELKKLVIQVRRDILRMVHGVGSGHPGGAMGCTEYFV